MEQNPNEQDILILSDESDGSDDEDQSFTVFSSSDPSKTESKKALARTLVEVKINRTIAIK